MVIEYFSKKQLLNLGRGKSRRKFVLGKIKEKVKDNPKIIDKIKRILKDEWGFETGFETGFENGQFKLPETVRQQYQAFATNKGSEYESEDEKEKVDGKDWRGNDKKMNPDDSQRYGRMCSFANKLLALIELEKVLLATTEEAKKEGNEEEIKKVIAELEQFNKSDNEIDEYVGKIRLSRRQGTSRTYQQEIQFYINELEKKKEPEEKKEEPEIKTAEEHNIIPTLEPEERNWTLININFTPELKQQWENQDFDYLQTQDWINVGLTPNDAEFATWLRDIKGLTLEEALNQENSEELRDEFNYQSLSDEAKLDYLKTDVRLIVDKIINDTAEHFSEETHGKWFNRLEGIKNTEAPRVINRLRGAGTLTDYSELGKITRLVDNGKENSGDTDVNFVNKKVELLEQAKAYFIDKVERLGYSDEEINGLYDYYTEENGWKEDIRGRDNIVNLIVHVNDDLIAKINDRLGEESNLEISEPKEEPQEYPPINLDDIDDSRMIAFRIDARIETNKNKVGFDFESGSLVEKGIEGVDFSKVIYLEINFDETEGAENNDLRSKLKNNSPGDIIKIVLNDGDLADNFLIYDYEINAKPGGYKEIRLEKASAEEPKPANAEPKKIILRISQITDIAFNERDITFQFGKIEVKTSRSTGSEIPNPYLLLLLQLKTDAEQLVIPFDPANEAEKNQVQEYQAGVLKDWSLKSEFEISFVKKDFVNNFTLNKEVVNLKSFNDFEAIKKAKIAEEAETESESQTQFKKLLIKVNYAENISDLENGDLSEEGINNFFETNSELSDYLKDGLKLFRDAKRILIESGFAGEKEVNVLNLLKGIEGEIPAEWWEKKTGQEQKWFDFILVAIFEKKETAIKVREITMKLLQEGFKIYINFFQSKKIKIEHRKYWINSGLDFAQNGGLTTKTEVERAWEKGWQDLGQLVEEGKIRLKGKGKFDYQWIEGEWLENLSFSQTMKALIIRIAGEISEIPTKGDKDLINYTPEYFANLKNSPGIPEAVVEKLEAVVNNQRNGWWERFFRGKAEIKTEEQKKSWRKSGLSPEKGKGTIIKKISEADKAFQNGWTDISSGSEFKKVGRGKYEYTNAKYKEKAVVELLVHKKTQVDQALEICALIKREEEMKNLSDKNSEIKEKIKTLQNDLVNRTIGKKDDTLPSGITIEDLTKKLADRLWELRKEQIVKDVNQKWEENKAKLTTGSDKNTVLGNNWENGVRNTQNDKIKLEKDCLINLIDNEGRKILAEIAEKIINQENEVEISEAWNDTPSLAKLVELKKVIIQARRVENSREENNIVAWTDEEIEGEIKKLKEFEEYKGVIIRHNPKYSDGWAWNKWNQAKEKEANQILKTLEKRLKARQEIEAAIKAEVKASGSYRDMFRKSGIAKLTDITPILQKLQSLIPGWKWWNNDDLEDNLSLTGVVLTREQFYAYRRKEWEKKDGTVALLEHERTQKRVSQRELELLKMVAKFADHDGKDWGFELSEEEKQEIDNAKKKEELEEVQTKISSTHTCWDTFFARHGLTEKKDTAIRNSWQTTYSEARGYEEAEKVYTKALEKYSEDENWEVVLNPTQIEKINQAKNPPGIREAKEKIRWEAFFAACSIPNTEWNAWQVQSGLTVPEARIAFGLGWEKLNDKCYSKLGNKKVKYTSTTTYGNLSTTDVELTKHNRDQMNRFHQLYHSIHNALNLTTLRAVEITEESLNWEEVKWTLDGAKGKWKAKELELFKAAFENAVPSSPSLIAKSNSVEAHKNGLYQSWLNCPRLPGNGPEERKISDNGWRPDEIYLHAITSVPQVEFSGIFDPINWVGNVIIQNIDPTRVKKSDLELVRDLLADINSKTESNELFPHYARTDEIDSLPDEASFPTGFRKDDVKQFLGDKFDELDKIEFIKEVKDKITTVASLTDNQIYDFRIRRSPTDEEFQMSSEWIAKSLDNGWTNPAEILIDDDGFAYAEVDGQRFDPTVVLRNEAEKKIWAEKFRNIPTLKIPPSEDEALKYKKNGIPVEKAHSVYENDWDSKDFNWDGNKANISAYASFGETDHDFCGAKVSKKELDKVNGIIEQIKKAKKLTDLISENEALKYEEGKVPEKKGKIWVKGIHTAKYNKLERTQKEDKIQPDITQIENELSKKPVISARELTNSDYQNQLLNLADQDSERESYKTKVITEITDKRNSKLSQIKQVIANVQIILSKKDATKKELEKAINDLKILTKASNDSAEILIWKEKETENKKLLTDLEEKLSKVAPPQKDKENLPPPPAPNQPLTPEQKEIYGDDWKNLKENQRIARQEVIQKWEEVKKEVQRESCCSSCQKTFGWDKSLNYSTAKKKVLTEIENCQKVCSSKTNSNQMTQESWQQERKTKSRNIYSCPHCWGKIVWDKSIDEVELAKKQAIADWNYHQSEECHKPENEKIVAIYFSPNRGGTKHAPLNYGENVKEPVLEKDDQGQIWQEQVKSNNQPINWTPWIVGGGILLISGLLLTWLFNKKRKRKRY